jgi:hypothetical protein
MTDNQCNHVNLQLLTGPLHEGGKDYYCPGCGEQFRAEPIVIRVQMGTGKQASEK